jgi:hypothetical protein
MDNSKYFCKSDDFRLFDRLARMGGQFEMITLV